jgi:hypothetical protein
MHDLKTFHRAASYPPQTIFPNQKSSARISDIPHTLDCFQSHHLALFLHGPYQSPTSSAEQSYRRHSRHFASHVLFYHTDRRVFACSYPSERLSPQTHSQKDGCSSGGDASETCQPILGSSYMAIPSGLIMRSIRSDLCTRKSKQPLLRHSSLYQHSGHSQMRLHKHKQTNPPILPVCGYRAQPPDRMTTDQPASCATSGSSTGVAALLVAPAPWGGNR